MGMAKHMTLNTEQMKSTVVYQSPIFTTWGRRTPHAMQGHTVVALGSRVDN